MKRLILAIPLLAAAMMLNAAPARSIENSMGTQEGATPSRDECLLVAMNCRDNVDSIQQRIDRLNQEISRGTDVYTSDELRILQQKLDEAHRIYDHMRNDRPTGAGV